MEAAISAAKLPVHFVECDLEGVDLSRLDLSRFVFERCALIECNLSYSEAVGSTWISCRARKTLLRGADFGDAKFKAGDWNNSEWQEAQLSGARFDGTKLTGADFRGAKAIGTEFADCPMQSAMLSGLSFSRSQLGRCDMTSADLRKCDFRYASFAEGSSIASSLIDQAKFEGCDLREASLSGHGIASLKILAGARISLAQAAAIVSSAGVKVG